jgi:hypothetical protein
MEETVRLPLEWAPVWAPFGLLIGGSASRCWVEVTPTEVVASFGPLAEARFPRAAVRAARTIRWPWWRGFGIRWYEGEAVGFVGRGRGVVELDLEPAQVIKAVLQRRVRRLALSPSEPERLLALLGVAPDPS